MKKHYVVLEFTPEHEGDVNGIPWADLLAGGVKVTDYQYVTQPMSNEDAMIRGMNDCISGHECADDKTALELIIAAAEKGDDVPDEITIYEPLETYDVKSLLVEIEVCASGYVGMYSPLNKANTNTDIALVNSHHLSVAIEFARQIKDDKTMSIAGYRQEILDLATLFISADITTKDSDGIEEAIGTWLKANYVDFTSNEDVASLKVCAQALLVLYYETSTCDGFNSNLEGPENDAEQGALKALQAINLI